MSHIISGLAQRRVVGSSARKSVLMFMAGCASDDGSGIWTSKANMARDLEMSVRTIHAAIQDMIGMGVISQTGIRPCRNGYTYEYCIDPAVLGSMPFTRAADAPMQQMHPTHATHAGVPMQQMHPNLPLTIHEPSLIDRFDEFWDQYPHRGGAKKGKQSAQAAWQRQIKAGASPPDIIAGALRYAADRQVVQGYAKDPTTWLNQKGWNDDIEPDSPPPANGTHQRGPGRAVNSMVAGFAFVADQNTRRQERD